ncbi:MAG: fasciclin domain-containing protein [Akkermansiaceae bacterium]|nr:fasciclin domain-containing protein [Armatimonadota bacterium]
MMVDKPMGGSTGMNNSGGVGGSASAATGTIVDVAMSDPQFSTLVAAIKAAGLVDTLKGPGPFTVFAPTNEAFAKLPAGALEDLLKPENKEKLVGILTYHVVPGKIKAADVMGMSNPSMPTTVNGKQLNVKTTAPVMINSSNVIKTDIEASNGVIHVIDAVLMPDTAATGSSSLPQADPSPSNPAPTTPPEPTTPTTPSEPTTPTPPTPPSTP